MGNGIMGLITKKAPDFPKGFTWLSVKSPLALAELSGNIVILDFWTYCCINCMHMLPILARIEEKYKDKPVVVIGVHSAKFENEGNPENITEAIARYGINHPVIVDKGMHIWREYGVMGWPTFVIVGATGNVEFKTSGEMSFEQFDQLVSDAVEKAERAGTLAKKRASIQISMKKTSTTLSYPGKMSFSKDGSSFALSDSNHNRVVIVETSSGKIKQSIGGPSKGFADGSFDKARFYRPQGVLWQGDLIYVADTENHSVREINLKSKAVRTIAGTGKKGFYVSYGTEYTSTDTDLNSPWDLATDGKALFIAMAGLHQIWRYDIKSGTITPFAGSGRENITDGDLQHADFAQPSGLWLTKDVIYVADSEVSGIRSISLKNRYVSTIVGEGLFVFGDAVGSLSDTLLQHPLGVSANGSQIYVADTYNSSIKAIDVKSGRSQNVISGKGTKAMCRIDDPHCDTLGLFEPNDVKMNDNTLYIVDTNNHLVRYFDMKDMLLKTLKVAD